MAKVPRALSSELEASARRRRRLPLESVALGVGRWDILCVHSEFGKKQIVENR